MTLTTEDRQAIIEYRIERAHNTMKEVEFIITGKFWNLAANRLYYSVFYICEALLLSRQISASSHTGVSRMMHLHFIKNGILNEEEGALLGRLFRMRQTGDYDDLWDWTERDILPLISETKHLMSKIESLIFS
ncbi:MAG: HEPN domain-containing protein [Muribaculaceae bacterium]|nr:HEPN domain-containing protein [Muribaculaceae bacterium]